MKWMDDASKEDQSRNEVLSFHEYMEVFEQNPQRATRPSYRYLLDMLASYHKTTSTNYTLFEILHDDAPAVYGQHKILETIIQNLKNFSEEGFNNKFILLVGPNGSAKSSFIRKFMKGAEDYSKSPEGALYSFSWVFPIDNFVKGSLGLTSKITGSELNSYAHLEDKDISAILPSEMRDHPLLLVPANHRRQLIDETMGHDKELLDSVKKSYLYRGDLSKRNRMVYDALLKNYKGNHKEVLKHVRVERFNISRRYSISAVTIEPQLHVDATVQQITMDRRLASLPPSLQSLNLFQIQGEVMMANRGILEYSDLLKRPLDTFKYLLMTMETANINLQGILTELDIFFIGTSNEIHLSAFKQHPDYNSFKGRFNFIKVPYLLDYLEEERIYAEQIEGLRDRTIFEPFALRALCLFAIMTRLRSPQTKDYEDKKLSHIATDLNPIQKALLLSSKHDMPDGMDSESKQVLRVGIKDITDEYEHDSLYEGKFGLSPRDIKKIIYQLSETQTHITFIEVLEYLKDLLAKKGDYDFLNMTPHGDYHHPARFLSLIKTLALDLFDRELRDSLGLVDNRTYEDYIRRYITNINAYIKGEKIKNEITGKFEPFDDFFIKEFESNIALKEDVQKFRSFLIAKLGAYSLDNPGKSIVYATVFPDIVDALRESFRTEQKKCIENVAKTIVFYEAELTGNAEAKSGALSENDRKQILTVIGNLELRYKYSREGALALLKYLIKERY